MGVTLEGYRDMTDWVIDVSEKTARLFACPNMDIRATVWPAKDDMRADCPAQVLVELWAGSPTDLKNSPKPTWIVDPNTLEML